MVTSRTSPTLPTCTGTGAKSCFWTQTNSGSSATYPRSNNIPKSMLRSYNVPHPSSNTSPAPAIPLSPRPLQHGNKPNLMTPPFSLTSRPTLCFSVTVSHFSRTLTSRLASWFRLLSAKLSFANTMLTSSTSRTRKYSPPLRSTITGRP
jgi:hypothetical protein